MQNFQSYNEIKSLVQSDFDEMEKYLKQSSVPAGTGSDNFQKEIENYLQFGSKQLRSCLVFLFSRLLYDEVDENTIKLAAAVEIVHNATLIHDDIIDNSETRRGKTALHKKYGNKLSIITGDFLLSRAIKILTSVKVPVIIEIFSQCLENLCTGEIKQYFSTKTTPSMQTYIEKSEAKTASLFSAALTALAAIDCSPYQKDLEHFAKHFGIAFQIRDDLNNLTDENEQKPLFSDISNGIYTAPIIFAFGENKDLSQITTDKIYSTANTKENIEKTKQLIKEQIVFAKNALENIPQDIYKNAILDLCEIICK